MAASPCLLPSFETRASFDKCSGARSSGWGRRYRPPL